VAGYVRFLASSKDEKGERIEYKDKMAEELVPHANHAYSTGDVKPFMHLAFGENVAQSEMVCKLISSHLMNIKEKGVEQTILDQLKQN